MLNWEGQVRVYLHLGITDMRKGAASLRNLIPMEIKEGNVFVFRGRAANKVKVLWFDGQGSCLFYKNFDYGRIIWPNLSKAGGTCTLSKVQLMMLLEGLEWRGLEHGSHELRAKRYAE